MIKRKSVKLVIESMDINWNDSGRTCVPVVLRLHRIHDHLHGVLDEILIDYNIQRADFGVLETLRRANSTYCLSPTQLYNEMLFSSGGLTKVLNRLVDQGYIKRIDNPKDKRSRLVQLTCDGKSLIEELIKKLHRNEQRFMSVLTLDEQKQLDILLEKALLSYD